MVSEREVLPLSAICICELTLSRRKITQELPRSNVGCTGISASWRSRRRIGMGDEVRYTSLELHGSPDDGVVIYYNNHVEFLRGVRYLEWPEVNFEWHQVRYATIWTVKDL